MDGSIEVYRTAVRTNYFPLWESEATRYRFIRKVNKPKPITELTRLLGKLEHLKEKEPGILQGMVDKRYPWIKTLCDSFETPSAA